MYTVFYQLTLAFCKISILLLYTRILAYTHARRAALAVIAIVIAYNIFGFVSTLGRCRPLAAFWDNSVRGECNPASHMWALISLHIATDFLIFLLPIPLVYRMTMPLGQKIGVLLIFGLGFLYHPPLLSRPHCARMLTSGCPHSVCLVSILRAVWIRDLYDAVDVTWDYVAISNWTAVEVNVSILVPCLIVLKPLLSKLIPALSGVDRSDAAQGAPPTIGSDPADPESAGVHLDTGPSETSTVCHSQQQEMEVGHGYHRSI